MYKILNGKKVELTAEEIAVLESMQDSNSVSIPTTEERLAALESAMIAMLGGASDV